MRICTTDRQAYRDTPMKKQPFDCFNKFPTMSNSVVFILHLV